MSKQTAKKDYRVSCAEAFASIEAINNEAPVKSRWTAATVYQQMAETAAAWGDHPALSFQLKSGATDPAETWTWNQVLAKTTAFANYLRTECGVGETDVVAYLLPSVGDTMVALMGAMTAGVASPINPLLEVEQIAAILEETKAKVLITLKPFPKADLAQKAAAALQFAPHVETVIEIDLLRHLTPPTSWLVPLLRPKVVDKHNARIVSFDAALASTNSDALTFTQNETDRVCAYFHTGGTTGMPKLAQHRPSGMLFNGWATNHMLYEQKDVFLCPLPLFHVFAVYPIWMGAMFAGAHMVLPTPAGYRGEGVLDNFWKLVERYGATKMIMVPTAAAALIQRPVDADVSTLNLSICGSAPLPLELFNDFERITGVNILEGYGMTEATCIVACNPANGEPKVGSVGVPFPYADFKIAHFDDAGNALKECGTDEIGEICVSCPGVFPGNTYTDASKNVGLYYKDKYLRTGDLGRFDSDRYLWITGRAKDLIIRGGHNIDPAMIEEALMGHPAVAFAGAIGQPDAKTGEMPCAYVELNDGAEVTTEELIAFAEARIPERAAFPKYIEVLDELPKTAVGKTFKPDLRKSAITRIYNAALADAGIPAEVSAVVEDKKRGLVAQVTRTDHVDDAALKNVLGDFIRPWEWMPSGQKITENGFPDGADLSKRKRDA